MAAEITYRDIKNGKYLKMIKGFLKRIPCIFRPDSVSPNGTWLTAAYSPRHRVKNPGGFEISAANIRLIIETTKYLTKITRIMVIGNGFFTDTEGDALREMQQMVGCDVRRCVYPTTKNLTYYLSEHGDLFSIQRL